jgi:hypothetical protein
MAMRLTDFMDEPSGSSLAAPGCEGKDHLRTALTGGKKARHLRDFTCESLESITASHESWPREVLS